ncbi:choice-of-anchor I family protein [Cocleimonas flava]|nr:choice-of-anchor I family protein [Cocleimonas flava]
MSRILTMRLNRNLPPLAVLLLSSTLIACNSSSDDKSAKIEGYVDSVATLDFQSFNAQENALEAKGLRVFGPNADLAADLEPEYVTVSADSTTAWVSLQENNGIAKVDLLSATITDIFPLGFKDHGAAGNELDASDKDDDAVILRSFPNLKGMYQPDGIASFEQDGVTYIVSANEGDAREYDGFVEESRVEDITLNASAFPDAATLQDETILGRLNITQNLTSAVTQSTPYTTLNSYGARSFSIWNGETGALVFDSGSDLAKQAVTAGVYPDGRSDSKGTEPENVAIGTVAGKRLAFIGLERANAVAVYDISDLSDVTFVEMLTHADDVAPEGILFISADDSPNELATLIVSNEVSGSITIYEADADGKFGTNTGRLVLVGGEAAAEISAYDKTTKRLFVLNNGEDLTASQVDVIDISDTANPVLESSISTSTLGGGINSVAVSNGLLAVAIQADEKTDAGKVAIYDTDTLSLIDSAVVGALPDMVTFSKDGTMIITADEGEPNDDYSIDPIGSVSIIRLK